MYNNIKGITYYENAFLNGQDKHYFGFDDLLEDLFIEAGIDFIIRTDFDDSEHFIFDEFIKAVFEKALIETWDDYYHNQEILDGVDWKVILHFKDGTEKVYQGLNKFPSNFQDFIDLCKQYDFAFIDDIDNFEIEENNRFPFYDDFLQEVHTLENQIKCPECESEYVVHTSPLGYDFMCGDCGHIFIYEKGKYAKEFQEDLEKNKN